MTLSLFPNGFNPTRLGLARRLRGLKNQELAKLAKLTPVSVSQFETGARAPSERSVALLAAALAVPELFFYGETIEEPAPDFVSFRAMSKMSAAQRNSALAAGAMAIRLNAWLEERFYLPKPDIPHLANESDPESAADIVRRLWGLGELTIRNLVHLLESKGVRVFSLSVQSRYLDAFSMWHEGVPYIFLNTFKSAERSRFDAAHELGHLVLHHAGAKGREVEAEANNFASAFLMSRGSVLASGLTGASIGHLLQWKTRWNVSVGALARRLYGLQLLTEWQYRQTCIELASRGYLDNEPNPCEREVSLVLSKAFASLKEDGMSRKAIADSLLMNPDDLNDLVFGIAFRFKSVNGGRQRSGGLPKPAPDLTVLEGGRRESLAAPEPPGKSSDWPSFSHSGSSLSEGR